MKQWSKAAEAGKKGLAIDPNNALLQGTLNAAGFGIRVKVDSKDGQFISAGSVYKHKIELTNYSLQFIKLSAEPSCGCTLLDDMNNRFLSPFGKTSLNLELHTKGMKLGTHNKPVTLYFQADPKHWQEVVPQRFTIQ